MSEPVKTTVSTKGAVKFVVCSLIGIFLFFVQIPINGANQLPIDFITSLFTNALKPYPTQVLLVCSVLYLVNLVRIKGWQGSTASKIIMVFSVLGAVMVVMQLFHIGPAFMFESDIIPAAVSNMANAFVMVYVITFFLPFLLNFGLVDFVGVIFQPVMRKIFRLPGTTAVVAIGAFLGNFTVGHIQSNQLYTEGKLSTREANIISTSLCTTSIALLLMFANANGQSANWTTVFLTTAFLVYVVTALTARIPPLSKVPDTYYENMEAPAETGKKGNLFKEAWITGVEVAEKAPNPFLAMWNTGSKSLMMVAGTHVSAVSLWVFPALVNKYTPIFTMLGYLFLPIIKLFGVPNAGELANAVGLSFVNPISATLGLGAMTLDPAAKFFAACFAAPLVIFFGAFLASLYSTKVPVKFWHVLVIWLERAILTVLILSIICMIMF